MSHFAKVVNGIVTHVIVAEPEYFDTFIDDTPGTWVQTSYNTKRGVHYIPDSMPLKPSADQSKALRYNFAGIGYTYDKVADAFIEPKPYPSWILNTDGYYWDSPVPYPAEDLENDYNWDEEAQAWVIAE